MPQANNDQIIYAESQRGLDRFSKFNRLLVCDVILLKHTNQTSHSKKNTVNNHK